VSRPAATEVLGARVGGGIRLLDTGIESVRKFGTAAGAGVCCSSREVVGRLAATQVLGAGAGGGIRLRRTIRCVWGCWRRSRGRCGGISAVRSTPLVVFTPLECLEHGITATALEN
jgi:hypothetical protein